MFHDPCVAGAVKMPAELIPKAAAPTAPATALAAPVTGVAPTSMASTFVEVHKVCSAAQAAAFPGVDAAVAVAVSDRAGVDYQNNSAMGLFGIMKKALPDGIKSPRDCAERLAKQMKAQDSEGLIASVEIAGPGFINMQLSTAWLSNRVHQFVLHGVLPPPNKSASNAKA